MTTDFQTHKLPASPMRMATAMVYRFVTYREDGEVVQWPRPALLRTIEKLGGVADKESVIQVDASTVDPRGFYCGPRSGEDAR